MRRSTFYVWEKSRRQQKRPGARRTGRHRQPCGLRGTAQFTCAGCPDQGSRSPVRSLRLSCKRDSIQRSSAPPWYGQGAGGPNRVRDLAPPPAVPATSLPLWCRNSDTKVGSPVLLGEAGAGGRGQGAGARGQGAGGRGQGAGARGHGGTGANAARRGGLVRNSGGRPESGARRCSRARGQAEASSSSSVKLRVLLGSTGMPGPIVVVKVTFFRYRPLAAAGLSLITSSRAAA